MAKAAPLSEETRAEIVAALREGKSQGGIARTIGVSQPTVHRIAKAEGLNGIHTPQIKAMNERKTRDYDLPARLELINLGLEHLRSMLDGVTSPQQMERWSMSLCQLVDKRRLEEGEVTSRTETVSSAGARERVADRITQLAQRKASVPAPVQPQEQDSPPIPAAAQDATTMEQPDAYAS